MTMRNVRSLLTAVALLPLVALAADPPKEISARFRAISLDIPIERAAFISGRQTVPLSISADFFSPEQTYRGPETLPFLLLAAPPAAPDARTPMRLEMRNLEAVAAAETAKHDALAARAGVFYANAAEGPEGDAARNAAEELMRQAAVHADKASSARNAATAIQNRIDLTPPPPPPDPKKIRPVDTARNPPSPLAEVLLTEGSSSIILFATSPSGTRAYVMPEPAGANAMGTLRFINVGKTTLKVRSREATKTVPTMGFADLVPTVDAFGYAGLEILGTDPAAKALRIIRARPESDARTTYFLTEERAGILRIKGVTERAPR